jgi:hypothetical protein
MSSKHSTRVGPAKAHSAAAPAHEKSRTPTVGTFFAVAGLGNQAMQAGLRAAPLAGLWSGAVHAKLKVGGADDPEERSADQTADQVMVGSSAMPCACGGTCPACSDDVLRRKERAAPTPESAGSMSLSGGRALDRATRAFFEPRLGRDLSRVQVHTGPQASAQARAIAARAFTIGNDIVFGEGEYRPGTHEGNSLLAHELAHVLHQDVAGASAIRRQTMAPPGPAVSTGTSDLEKDLLDREERALAQITALAGSQIASFAYESPLKPEHQFPGKPPTAALTMGAPVPRPTSETQKRRGFDSQGEATAFAAVIGGPVGAVVLAVDKLWFAAPLTATSASEFTRSHVYRFTVSVPAVAAVGSDGFVFTAKDYIPEEETAAKVDRPEKELAAPAAAADLRKMVGIVPEDWRGEGKAKPLAVTPVPAGREEAFIRSYFIARALEALNENEVEADKLAQQFTPTRKADGTAGLDPSAQKMIDQTRDVGPTFRQLESVERMLGEQALWLHDKHWEGQWRITVKGQTKGFLQWRDDVDRSLRQIAESKQTILSAFPMLATLVRREETPSDAAGWAAKLGYERFEKTWIEPALGPGAKLLSWAWGKFTTAGLPPTWDDSPLAKAKSEATAEDNEKIVADFRTKLDKIHRAIAETRGKVTGDLDFVLGMSSLRSRVKADIAHIDPRNQSLREAMDKLLLEHDIEETAIKVAETVIQIAALFLPGGQFISAAIGFAVQAKEMDKHLDAWMASQATVDPAKALVDQQQAESALLTDTIMMAAQAVDLAISVRGGFEALEAGRVPKGEVPEKPAGPEVPDVAKSGEDRTRKARALEDPEQMKKFATEAPALQAAWQGYKTPQERGHALLNMVNERLESAGIPKVNFALGDARGGGGLFDHESWTIVLDQKYLAKETLTTKDLTWMIEASYHEARHAEQFFMMARREAGMGKSAEQLMKEVKDGGLAIADPKVANAAVAQKLAVDSPEALQAAEWYESIYGAGREARQKLLKDMDLARKEVRLREIELEQLNRRVPPPSFDELEEAKKELAEAEGRAEPLIDAYKKLPEEADAYRVGEEAAKAYRQYLQDLTDQRIQELRKELEQLGH